VAIGRRLEENFTNAEKTLESIFNTGDEIDRDF
jgi:hypothetical protein